MNLQTILQELNSYASENTKRTYRRHGAVGEVIGVKIGDIKKIKKRIKFNHELSMELWKTQIFECKILATLIADPKTSDNDLLESWVDEIHHHTIADAFASNLVIKTELAKHKMGDWAQSTKEMVSRCGFNLIATFAKSPKNFRDKEFITYLQYIEDNIHTAPNRTKQAMNIALISIGSRNKDLNEAALLVAKRIGKIEIDHGETACKSYDAEDILFHYDF